MGARGYSGLELSKILLRHPAVDLKSVYTTSSFRLEQFLTAPKAKSVSCLLEKDLEKDQSQVVFLATPAEASLKLAPKLLAQKKVVIDLSGAFRLKENDYQKWYGFKHDDNELCLNAHYGLQPYMKPHLSALIANPGCYATAILMASLPLLKRNLILHDTLVIDAKSGATGAGRKAHENLIFTEVDGECLPYKVGQHQHTPEIMETIKAYTSKSVDLQFTTSLLPVRRGIVAALYAKVPSGTKLTDITDGYQEMYEDYELVSFGELEKQSHLLSLKRVVGTPQTQISYQLIENKLYVFSLIDNLLKGAASQAVENFNQKYDLPLTTGLREWEGLI